MEDKFVYGDPLVPGGTAERRNEIFNDLLREDEYVLDGILRYLLKAMETVPRSEPREIFKKAGIAAGLNAALLD